MGLLLVSFIGLIFGSFATALAYRIPREISIVTKVHSSCTHCGRNLSFVDLIPLLSWLCLGGKCRTCKHPIGFQYPLIELATLLMCLLFYSVYDFNFTCWPLYLMAPLLVAMIDIDFRFKILPDCLNFGVFILGLVIFINNSFLYQSPFAFVEDNMLHVIGGLLIYGGGFYALRLFGGLVLKREAMGFGDIKLMAALGPWLGYKPEIFALFLTVSGLSGVILALLWRYEKGEREFPFGPSLIIGFITAMCLYPLAYS